MSRLEPVCSKMRFLCVVAADGRDQSVASQEALMLTFKIQLILLFLRTPLCLEMHFFVIVQRELICRAGRAEGKLGEGRGEEG